MNKNTLCTIKELEWREDKSVSIWDETGGVALNCRLVASHQRDGSFEIRPHCARKQYVHLSYTVAFRPFVRSYNSAEWSSTAKTLDEAKELANKHWVKIISKWINILEDS